jgi:hypothetical protein
LLETTTVDGNLWWHAQVESDPALQGYILGTLVDDFNDCQSTVPNVPPPTPPLPQANESCIVKLNFDTTVYDGNNVQTGTLDADTEIQVYGMNYARERYLINLPGTLPQEWIVASFVTPLPANIRGCDRNALGRFYETVDASYWSVVGYYANNFVAPVDPTLYTNDYASFRNSYYYDRVVHEGTDVAYRPPEGAGNAQDFDVHIMASGVVVDASPDGITRSYRYEKVICPALGEPPSNIFAGRAGVFHFVFSTPCSDGSAGIREQYYFAVMYDEDDNPDNNSNEAPTVSYTFGLNSDQVNILKAGGFVLASGCQGEFGCVDGPGRRLIIWYNADGTNDPDIQTTYYHVNMNTSGNYTDWNNTCTNRTRADTWTKTIVNNDPNFNVCRVNVGIYIGRAELIGFTTGVHLHQEVLIDKNNDGSFANTGTDEDEDPLMAFQTIR